jgi:hypothetical protein
MSDENEIWLDEPLDPSRLDDALRHAGRYTDPAKVDVQVVIDKEPMRVVGYHGTGHLRAITQVERADGSVWQLRWPGDS